MIMASPGFFKGLATPEGRVCRVSSFLVIFLLFFLVLHAFFFFSALNDLSVVGYSGLLVPFFLSVLYLAAFLGVLRRQVFGSLLAVGLGGLRIILLCYSGVGLYRYYQDPVVFQVIAEQCIMPAVLCFFGILHYRLLLAEHAR